MSQQINLYNPIFLKQKKIFAASTMAQALAVILVGALAFAAFAGYQVRKLDAEVKSGAALAKAEEARLASVKVEFAARTPSAALAEEVGRRERELKMREDIIGLLSGGGLSDAGALSPYLRALARQNLNGLWLTGFELTGKDMVLSGRALRAELVPEYLRRLGREPVMQGRQFAMLSMQEPKGAEEKDGKTSPPRFIEFSLRSVPPQETK